MTGEEILEIEDKDRSMWSSRRGIWDEITSECQSVSSHGQGHSHDYDCEECYEKYDERSVEEGCDSETSKKIMGGISSQEHHQLLNKLKEKINSMNLTVEIEC